MTTNQTIQAWGNGLGVRITAPSYGAAGSPPKIGPNATLVFYVKLNAIA